MQMRCSPSRACDLQGSSKREILGWCDVFEGLSCKCWEILIDTGIYVFFLNIRIIHQRCHESMVFSHKKTTPRDVPRMWMFLLSWNLIARLLRPRSWNPKRKPAIVFQPSIFQGEHVSYLQGRVVLSDHFETYGHGVCGVSRSLGKFLVQSSLWDGNREHEHLLLVGQVGTWSCMFMEILLCQQPCWTTV